MTNFGLADSFLRLLESQNDLKEVIRRFKKYVYFPRYSGVRMLQVRDRIIVDYDEAALCISPPKESPIQRKVMAYTIYHSIFALSVDVTLLLIRGGDKSFATQILG